MNRALRKSQSLRCCSVLEVKSKVSCHVFSFWLLICSMYLSVIILPYSIFVFGGMHYFYETLLNPFLNDSFFIQIWNSFTELLYLHVSQWFSWRSYLSIIRLKGNTFVNNNLNNQNLHNIQKRLTSKICPLFQLIECSPRSLTLQLLFIVSKINHVNWFRPVEHNSAIKIFCV